jgi:hypothetical protein
MSSRRGRPGIVAGALVGALALGLIACGGTTSESSDGTAPPDATNDGEVTDATGDTATDREFSDDPFSPDAAADDYPSSPLGEYMGWANVDPKEQEQQYRAQEVERQEVIAECMRAEGFEYTMFVSRQSFSFESPFEGLTRREYVEKYGFGISTTFNQDFGPPVEEQTEVDPNQEYVSSLSEAEQQAYYEALYGSPPEEPPIEETLGTDGEPVEVSAFEYVPQGCDGKAYREQNTPEDQQFMEDFNTTMSSEIWERMQADSRVVDATKRYAECMSEAGYPEITKQDEAYEEISKRMEPIYGSMDGGFATSETVAAASSDDGDVAVSGTDPAVGPGGFGEPEYDEALLAEVQEYELAVAKADLECGADLMRTMFEVNSELEAAFIAAHGDELARYKELTTP